MYTHKYIIAQAAVRWCLHSIYLTSSLTLANYSVALLTLHLFESPILSLKKYFEDNRVSSNEVSAESAANSLSPVIGINEGMVEHPG